MRISWRRFTLLQHFTCLTIVVLALDVESQKTRTNSRDLSRTIDTIIGIDIRDGKSGTYEPTTEESIVPRSRHTDRDSTKVSQKDILEELIASRYRVANKSEVNIEDFLTLGKEQRSTMPVS